jgi:hypothetical protein
MRRAAACGLAAAQDSDATAALAACGKRRRLLAGSHAGLNQTREKTNEKSNERAEQTNKQTD